MHHYPKLILNQFDIKHAIIYTYLETSIATGNIYFDKVYCSKPNW